MRSVRRFMIAIGLVAIAVFGSVSGAAAKPRPVLKVAPAKPGVKAPITVVFRAPKIKKRGAYYGADLTIGTVPNLPCTDSASRVALRSVPGGTFTATLKPRSRQAGTLRWCNGLATLEVRRRGPGGLYSRVLARRTFPVGTGQDEPIPLAAPGSGVPVKMTVLAGSTITASAPGRPDRSSPVSGTFRGLIPPEFKPNTDVTTNFTTGGLVPGAFPADPLCPGMTAPASFDLAAASPQTLFASGDASMTLVLNGAPSQLFGCGPAGPLSGTTTIPLTGKVVKGVGLLGLPLNGSVSGIPLPDGSTGGLAANLTVNVDLSGKG